MHHSLSSSSSSSSSSQSEGWYFCRHVGQQCAISQGALPPEVQRVAASLARERRLKRFLEAGGETFTLVPCLNDRADWIVALSGWCREALAHPAESHSAIS